MTTLGWLSMAATLGLVLLLAKPLGEWMARIYDGRPGVLGPVLGPVERFCYRASGIDPTSEMGWRSYMIAALAVNAVGLVAVYAFQRLQGVLPLNPAALGGVEPFSALNTAVAFASNTNWQGYGGETTMSYLTQMMALTVQNFLSAATGMAVLVALARGFARRESSAIGNFYADFVRSTLYILIPLALVLALALVSQGVVQTFAPAVTATVVDAGVDADGAPVTEQTIAVGPVASQIAIKQLGTNGGGYYNANSAHPLENPTPLSNLLELLAILLLPAALCITFGRLVGDVRQGWALLVAMTVLFIPLAAGMYAVEAAGNPRIAALGVDASAGYDAPGGNMEGKELRFGVPASAYWAAATTAASNGSVNAMHDSFTPLGGMIALFLMQLGEVVFGGVGSGLYGMLMFAVVTVFIAGLMVGRTPEYLGKKIEAYEMQMASLAVLFPCAIVLIGTAAAVMLPAALASRANPGAHGFSEILYAFTSMGNNNGSAFAGISANTPFYNLAGAAAMFASRFWVLVPVLALAGALAGKKAIPTGPGTLPTDRPLFIGFLVAVVIIVGALTFVPALALGPVAEHLSLWSMR
ncbi:MAG: potassium-transporting ATPase subunit KdpA [Ardenticatenales bacterium]|nr:potassium-transporting ATPase subunit KdpA [Ardenticatenales bacterium]